MMSTTRHTAEERRTAVLDAAFLPPLAGAIALTFPGAADCERVAAALQRFA